MTELILDLFGDVKRYSFRIRMGLLNNSGSEPVEAVRADDPQQWEGMYKKVRPARPQPF